MPGTARLRNDKTLRKTGKVRIDRRFGIPRAVIRDVVYALRRNKPCFLSQISKIEIAAGVIPEIRDAWPMEVGL